MKMLDKGDKLILFTEMRLGIVIASNSSKSALVL